MKASDGGGGGGDPAGVAAWGSGLIPPVCLISLLQFLSLPQLSVLTVPKLSEDFGAHRG